MFKRFGVVFVVTLAGCSSDNRDKIEGTKWISQEVVKEKEIAPKGGIRLEFQEDGTLLWTSGKMTIRGRYVLRAGHAPKSPRCSRNRSLR